MARGRCTFKQTDATRAARAVIAAGLEVQRVEIDRDGKIIVVTEKSETTAAEIVGGINEWDNLK
jgi:hypothetical protein